MRASLWQKNKQIKIMIRGSNLKNAFDMRDIAKLVQQKLN